MTSKKNIYAIWTAILSIGLIFAVETLFVELTYPRRASYMASSALSFAIFSALITYLSIEKYDILKLVAINTILDIEIESLQKDLEKETMQFRQIEISKRINELKTHKTMILKKQSDWAKEAADKIYKEI